MVSVFPELFFLSFFAPLLLRVAVALLFLYEAKNFWQGSARKPALAAGSGVIGVLLLAGAWTQPAALAGVIYVALILFMKEPLSVFAARSAALLAAAILLSLLATGAGAIAFDLPY